MARSPRLVLESEEAGGLPRAVERLRTFYGLLPAPPEAPFPFLVWEICSTYTTPTRRDAAFGAMRRARALTPDAIIRTPQAKLTAAMALAGPHRDQRLQALRAAADVFRRNPGLPARLRGPLSAARRALETLPLVGAAGVHRMLLFTTGHAILPADPAVLRVGLRLGYPSTSRPTSRQIQRALARALPAGDARITRQAFLYLAHHASTTCEERDPHCGVCPLAAECVEGRRRRGQTKGPGV